MRDITNPASFKIHTWLFFVTGSTGQRKLCLPCPLVLAMEDPKAKAHRKRQSGPKAEKKKAKKKGSGESTNPKAFTFKSAIKAARAVRRNLDKDSKRQRIPKVDRSPLEPPPVCVAVVGPPKVGKSTLIHDLVKNFTRQTITAIQGPVTVVSGM